MKLIINGKEVDVQEGAVIDTEAKGADEAEVKSLAEQVSKAVLAQIGSGDVKALSDKVDKIFSNSFRKDEKLIKIFGGKDVFAGEELTKEEKICGFFRALTTNNEPVLKALAEGVEADGGYLFPNEFLAELVRAVPAINKLREVVRVIPMRRDKMDVTSLISPVGVFWTAENAAKSTTTARFAQATLTAKKMAAIIYASDELVEDSTEFDVVSLIIQLFSEAIATEEERVIAIGNGTTEPAGINSGSYGGVTGTGNLYDDVTKLFWSLPEQYRVNATWLMNDNTAKNIELQKDSEGRPLWNVAGGNLGPTIKGRPVKLVNWIPDRTVFFGDFKKGYFLGDRKRMTVKVTQDSETAFTKDQTGIRVVARIGGLVALPAAIKKGSSF